MPSSSRLVFRPTRSRDEGRDAPPWPILVVDDDEDVHEMTAVLLRDLSFQGRRFEVVSARSGRQALAALAADPDIPVALVDVVMETPDAGLELVHEIRQRLKNNAIRLILRTGQPGEAPERDVVLAYDIHDYKNKAELTAQKLFTAVVGALRAWEDIIAIQQLKATLEVRIEERTRELAEARRFSERLIETIPNPVWFKDENGRYRLFNRAFRDLFAIADDGAITEAGCPQLVGQDLLSDAELLQGAGRVEGEIAIEAQGGVRTLLLAKSAITHEDGRRAGSIGVLTDITERKALECELQRLATTDPLTGCHNRRSFLAGAAAELERASRFGHPLALLALDIDHFKRVNDTWGHGVGDEALRTVVAVCRAGLREVDLFGRLGGEEFGIVLPETDRAGAAEVAERLRRAIAAATVPGLPGDRRLTVSLGVAAAWPGMESVDALLGAADDALYVSKREGRNRVSVAERGASTVARQI